MCIEKRKLEACMYVDVLELGSLCFWRKSNFCLLNRKKCPCKHIKMSLESDILKFIFSLRSPEYQLFKLHHSGDRICHYFIYVILILSCSNSRFESNAMLIKE